MQLGPGGCVGLADITSSSIYPAIDSLSDSDSIPDDEFSSNHTWGPVNSSLVSQAYRLTDGWRREQPRLSYKMITQAGLWFATGMYEFAQLPFVYEIVRQMLNGSLSDAHLPAPDWLLEEWFYWFCPNITWRNSYQSFYKHSVHHLGSKDGVVTFNDVTNRFRSSNDPHLQSKLWWISTGRWTGVPSMAWSPDIRVGRLPWEDDGTMYVPGSVASVSSSEDDLANLNSPRAPFVWRHPPFTNGGLSRTFDRRLHKMLQLAKFELLTQSIGDTTRDQYLKCWAKWAQFAACMDASPWLQHSQGVGWGEMLLGFLVWEHKVFGLQASTLAKRFYAIRFIHVTEGYDDISLRAHRVKALLKAVKLRGTRCKKIPFNTDLLRWIHSELNLTQTLHSSLPLARLWAGILCAFFFCLRISELLALTTQDIKFVDTPEGKVLSIIIRSSKTDQEKWVLPGCCEPRLLFYVLSPPCTVLFLDLLDKNRPNNFSRKPFGLS